jgi:NAD(P)-dependent dehydrogenase (short-subunit alcohol dehydrogenase family)
MILHKNKAALITGCNGGIGKALCQEFRAAGYVVVGTDMQEAGEADCDHYIRCNLIDLTTDDDTQARLREAVCKVLEKGPTVLRAIINNAAHQLVRPLRDLPVSEFLVSQQVNVIAPYAITRLFETALRESKGSIINIGSIHARLTKPGFCAYSTSKAALSGQTRGLALEFSGDVTVNTILPAATKTDMLLCGFSESPEKYTDLESYHPVGRIAEPKEIAKLALFLCSEDARFITGADISIDGGIGGRLHDPI